MTLHRRSIVILSVAWPLLLPAGCDRLSTTTASSSKPEADTKPAAAAKPAVEPSPPASVKLPAEAPPSAEAKSPASPSAPTEAAAPAKPIDLEALASDPAAALPGRLVRRGRYEVYQPLHEGELVVNMTEELTIHELGGRFVGRIASQSENTPMPPSFLVFVTDDRRRLEHVIWRGLRGTSAVEHELARASFRADGAEIELVLAKGPFSSSTERTPVAGAWTMGETLALEYLPLWSEAPATRSAKVEWSSLPLQADPEPQRIQLEPRGKQTVKVGGHEIDTWRYSKGKKRAPSVEIWTDERGLVVRRLEDVGDGPHARWETVYVPLEGDPLFR